MTFLVSRPRASGVGSRRCVALTCAIHAVGAILFLAAHAAHAQADAASASTATSLPPVLVTATRFADDANTLPFGVRVIRADDIRRAGVGTVNEALMKLLGVPGRQDLLGGNSYSLDLRGFGTTAGDNQVIVLDGVRLNEADGSGARLAGIPIETVERIEVVRGSGSVLFGEGAAGGVIVITTHAGAAAARENSAHLYGAVGSFGVRETRAAATVAAGEFSLDASLGRRLADNHRDNFKSRATVSSLSGQWQYEGLRIGASHLRDDLSSRLPGSLTAAQYASHPRQTNNPNDNTSIASRSNTVFARADLGDWELAAEAGWRSKELASLNTFGGSPSPFDYDVDADTQSVRAKYRVDADGLANVLVFGLDRSHWERNVTRGFPAGTVSTQRSTGVYLRDELTMASRTRLSAGLRSESVRKSDTVSTDKVDDRQRAWELGVLQPLGGGLSVYARLGRSFRLPNVDEFNFTSPNVPFRAQTSRDLEFGSRWIDGARRLEARLYRSNLTDEIGFDPAAPGPFGAGANVNLAPTRRQGIELELTEPLAESFKLHLNAALRRATFRAGSFAGNDVPLTPRRTLALRGEWQPAGNQQVDVLLNHVGPQSPDSANACRMPAYTTLDLRYAYRWERLEFAAGVSNAADRKYYTQAFTCTAGRVESIYPEAGRGVTASVRVDF